MDLLRQLMESVTESSEEEEEDTEQDNDDENGDSRAEKKFQDIMKEDSKHDDRADLLKRNGDVESVMEDGTDSDNEKETKVSTRNHDIVVVDTDSDHNE